MAFHPDITRRDDVSLALDAANSAVRIASRQLTGNAGTVEIPNADGTSTIMGVGAGGSGIAPWVGDTTAPGAPLGLSAESHNGAVWVTWDGTLDGGIPADFSHVQVTASYDAVSVDMGRLTAAGKVSAAELPAGAEVSITAVAYDDAHAQDGSSAPNASPVSDVVTVIVQSAVDAAKVQQAQDDAQEALNQAGTANNTSQTALTAAQAAQNDTVTNYVQQYAQNGDPNTAPTSGWSNTAPAWVAGTYIWVRTIVSYGSGDYDTTDPVLVTGNTGSQGIKGDKGDAGADGTSVTVKGTVATASDLPSTASAGDGYITSDDGHLHVWGSGVFTDVGQFKGEDGTPSYFHTAWSDSSDGSINFSTTDAGTRAYMGTYSDNTAADSTDATAYTWVKVQGNPGDDGIGVSSITPYYALASSAPAKPAIATPPAPWSITEPAYSATLNLYTTQKVLYSSGAFAYTDVQLSSVYSYAKAAKTTADGKNKIIPSATQPSSTGLVQGDLWFQLDSNNNVVGIQVWNGSSFADYLLLANEILVAGSVGTTQIKNGAITTDLLTSNAVTAIKIAAQTITGDKLNVGSVASAIMTSNLFKTSGTSDYTIVNDAGVTVYKNGKAYTHMGADAIYGLQAWNPGLSAMVDVSSQIFGTNYAYETNDLKSPDFAVTTVGANWSPWGNAPTTSMKINSPTGKFIFIWDARYIGALHDDVMGSWINLNISDTDSTSSLVWSSGNVHANFQNISGDYGGAGFSQNSPGFTMVSLTPNKDYWLFFSHRSLHYRFTGQAQFTAAGHCNQRTLIALPI